MTEPDRRVLKSTFEDCLDSQERLRNIITKLASENRCLDVSEQEEFFRELGHACYGMGRDKPFKISCSEGVLSLKNVEFAARFIASQKTNMVSIPNEFGGDMSNPIEIGLLWERLLTLLFGVFPIALDRSASMSKERDNTSGGDGYFFDSKE